MRSCEEGCVFGASVLDGNDDEWSVELGIVLRFLPSGWAG